MRSRFVLVINTMNAIELYTDDEVSVLSDEEEGSFPSTRMARPREAALLLKTMILGLREMADDENYAEYIDLTFEEV